MKANSGLATTRPLDSVQRFEEQREVRRGAAAGDCVTATIRRAHVTIDVAPEQIVGGRACGTG